MPRQAIAYEKCAADCDGLAYVMATVYILDSRTIVRGDIGFFVDYVMGPTRVLTKDPCLFGFPVIWTIAHMPLQNKFQQHHQQLASEAATWSQCMRPLHGPQGSEQEINLRLLESTPLEQ